MTERPGAGIQFAMSKLLVSAIVVAIAATAALLVTVLLALPGPHGPGPAPGQQQGMLPPPPPDQRPMLVLVVATGFFVLSWLAVLVIRARDQILVQRSDLAGTELTEALTRLRDDLTAEHDQAIRSLTERIEEFGERRETDGYLRGMRTAAGTDPGETNVRSFRRMPPQR